MTTYLIKTILCSAVLFLLYLLLLEREKMYRFNRFYLLFSIAFSFCVSFITIQVQAPVATVNEIIAPAAQATLDLPVPNTQKSIETTEPKNERPPVNLWFTTYWVITLILLFRFAYNLSALLFKTIRNETINYHKAKLVLTHEGEVPISFLRYIFIDKLKFETGGIEKEILQHELTHVEQKHSIDILMVELIMIFAWVNPVLYLFRKAIMLNHEYLADEAVLNTYHDPKAYQHLLYTKVTQTNNLVLSSPFNYLITKKRLIMMTRKTSKKVAIAKQIALVPLIAAIGFLFSTRAIAQDNITQQEPQKVQKSSKTNPPQSVVKEFNAILVRYQIDTALVKSKPQRTKNELENQENWKKWWKLTKLDTLYKADKSVLDKLYQLYTQMSPTQRNRAIINLIPKPTLRTKTVPTKTQFSSWQDPKMYGIRINHDRVKNSVLNNYSPSDFSYFEVKKVEKGAVKWTKYQVGVSLFTNDEFEKEERQTQEIIKKTTSNYLIVFFTPPVIAKDKKPINKE